MTKENNRERYEKALLEFNANVGPSNDPYDERSYLFNKFYAMSVQIEDLLSRVNDIEKYQSLQRKRGNAQEE